MAREPIIEFESTEQAQECLKEWQTRLFLDDWLIKLELADKGADKEFGQVCLNSDTQRATITLYQGTSNDSEIKKCMEKTLIHELLHCAFFARDYGDRDATVERWLYDSWEHRRVEKMAQSLIMAKYNLPFEWFRNF